MTEDELLRNVIDLTHLLGGKVAHFRPARLADGSWRTAVQGDGKGWPDCAIVTRDLRFLVRELKSETGEQSPEQVGWGNALILASVDFAIWRPKDWPDRIRAELEPRKADA